MDCFQFTECSDSAISKLTTTTNNNSSSNQQQQQQQTMFG